MRPPPLDLRRVKVFPLAERASLTGADEILIQPGSPAPKLSARLEERVSDCVARVRVARERGAGVML